MGSESAAGPGGLPFLSGLPGTGSCAGPCRGGALAITVPGFRPQFLVRDPAGEGSDLGGGVPAQTQPRDKGWGETSRRGRVAELTADPAHPPQAEPDPRRPRPCPPWAPVGWEGPRRSGGVGQLFPRPRDTDPEIPRPSGLLG